MKAERTVGVGAFQIWKRDVCMTTLRLLVRFRAALLACLALAAPAFAQSSPPASAPAPHAAGTPAPSSAVASAERSPAAPTDIAALIDLVLKRNPGLQSYSAAAHLDLRQVNFPYLHPVLEGHEYLSAPGFTVFDYPHTPFYLKGITKVQGAFSDATRWQRCYDITTSDQGDAYALHMVPKITGEISAVDLQLARDGKINNVAWYYRENPNDYIRLTQTYSNVQGYDVVTQQTSEVTLHHIRARGTQTFSAFRFNVPVPTPTPTPSNPLHACDN